MIHQETRPYDFDPETEFTSIEKLAFGEGFYVSSGVNDKGYWIIEDSRTMSEFLEDEDPLLDKLVSLKLYSKSDWDKLVLQFKTHGAPA